MIHFLKTANFRVILFILAQLSVICKRETKVKVFQNCKICLVSVNRLNINVNFVIKPQFILGLGSDYND